MPIKLSENQNGEQTEIKPSWADQVEQGDEGGLFSPTNTLPPPSETWDEKTGIKKVTDYKINDEGKKVKIIKTYKIEKFKVSKSVAKRKAWKKFGAAAGDPPGPNPASTVISEDIFLQFVHSKELTEPEDDPLARLRGKMVCCRRCKGDHWTNKCPYKDSLAPLTEVVDMKNNSEDMTGGGATVGGSSGGGAQSGGGLNQLKTGKYIPPNIREGGNKKGDSMNSKNPRGGDEAATIRVTNLSEDTRESDLQDLFRPFGSISRIFLAKDKVTGQSKGFAFINFHKREDAARAIAGISGYGYDHLILNVEWAKPSSS